MSRLFSITSRISDATMFSAATITIRPMVIEIAIFSSHSAENSALVHVAPVLRPRSRRRAARRCASATSRALNMSSTRSSMNVRLILAEHALGDVERDEAVLGVELEEPEAEDADDLERRAARHHADRRQRPAAGVISCTVSPTVTLELLARDRVPMQDAGDARRRHGAERLERCPSRIDPLDVGDGRLERRIDALDVDERRRRCALEISALPSIAGAAPATPRHLQQPLRLRRR